MKIKKASPGLDQRNRIGQILGAGFEIEDYDSSRPLFAQVADAEVLLVRDVPVPAAVMDAAPKLKLIQRPGHHLVGVDFDYAKKRDVFVSRFPSKAMGTPARDVAEHAFFLLLAVAKRYPASVEVLRQSKVGLPKTTRVAGKTLALVGVGNTGRELAFLAKGFGMRVIAVKKTADPALARELGLDLLVTSDRLHEVLAQADFVSVHLPHEPQTVDFLGEREFATMKPGAFLINIARGPMVNKAALHQALASGRLQGAGLDVYWKEPVDPADPLLALPNVVATPHIAGDTVDVEERIAQLAAENIRRISRGERPHYAVGIDVEMG